MLKLIVSLLFPKRCPFCHQIIAHSQTECDKCRRTTENAFLQRTIDGNTVCYAPFYYKGTVRKAIHNFKFHGMPDNADSFAAAIVRVLQAKGVKPDIVTFVPLHKTKKAERGYDQSEVLAKKIAEKMNLPYRRLLKKTKINQVQHTLSPEQRRLNVIGVYEAVRPDQIKGQHILLVDDICTTGSTLKECALMLRQAGALSVSCASVSIPEFTEAH